MKYLVDKNKYALWMTFVVISNDVYYSFWKYDSASKFCLRPLAHAYEDYKDCISFSKETRKFNSNINHYESVFNRFLNL